MSALTRHMVKTSRKRLGLTQRQLATYLGLSVVQIGRYETESAKPSHSEPSGHILARIIQMAYPNTVNHPALKGRAW